MSGIDLRGDELVVERETTALDELAIDVSAVLSDLDIDHALVAGYVAILAGRARSTEDIGLILERLDRRESGALATGGNVRVAPDGEVIPNVELKYATDEFDTASIDNAITASIGDAKLPIGPLELQIAYKLYLDTQKDFEDAVHIYTMFEESLDDTKLARWARKLDVEEEYERLG